MSFWIIYASQARINRPSHLNYLTSTRSSHHIRQYLLIFHYFTLFCCSRLCWLGLEMAHLNSDAINRNSKS